MSRAGQASEVGSVFRCAVATHLAVHGLRSHPVAGLDLPAGIDPVRLDFETLDPTDDIRVTFSDGRRGYISAKRRVNRGRPLVETVRDWVEQARSLGPDDLLILAGEELVGPARDLDRVLRRHRGGSEMETQAERAAFSLLADLVPNDIRDVVLERARILHIPASTGAAGSRSLLAALMDFSLEEPHGERAVTALADFFHRQAGEAAGSGIEGWVNALTTSGLAVVADRSGPAGMRAAARLDASREYRQRIGTDSGRIDLSLLAEDLPPIAVDDLVEGLKIDIPGSRTPDDLLRHLRRWRRMLVIGQPGSGKSVALREIAAHCVRHPHAPVPIRVALPRVVGPHIDQMTIDVIIDAAIAGLVAEEQRAPLAEYLREQVDRGQAIVLCDGLDECGARAAWAAQQLTDFLATAHPRLGFVLATRASAQLPAARLGLPRVELVAPRNLGDTVDEILTACSRQRIPEHQREEWLELRRTWIREAREQHGQLLEVPLLAVLLALVCANASESDLPKGRAVLLHRAVEESVHRWEQNRGTLDPARPWSPALTTAMLLEGFVVLGRLLDGGATPTRPEALVALGEMLRDPAKWNLPPASAREVGEQVLRFWDEHVAVFVVNAADELTSRSKVFAEIATAMWATACERSVAERWLAEAVAFTDSDGAIALAAGLDSTIIDALLTVGDTGSTEATLMVTDLSQRGVVALTSDQVRKCLGQLDSEARGAMNGEPPTRRGPKNTPTRFPHLWDETRVRGPWPFVEAACRLPLPSSERALRAELVERCDLVGPFRIIASAISALTDASVDDTGLGESAREAVHAALSLPLPPESKMVKESRRRSALVGGRPLTPGLAQVALAAADRLDELDESCAEVIFDIGMRATHGLGERIFAALTRAGVDTSRRWKDFPKGMSDWVSSHVAHELALLTDMSSLADPGIVAADSGLWSLTEFGDLLTATGYETVSTQEFARAFIHDDSGTRQRWLDALAQSYKIDKVLAASQAHYVRRTREEANTATRQLSDDWFVASAKPIRRASVDAEAVAALAVEQQMALLACLEADSDWIAWSAAEVLLHLNDPPWESHELFARDMSNWPRHRAALVYMVAISTAGSARDELLSLAAQAESADYRYAARMTTSIAPELDPDGSIAAALRSDHDMSVRPKDARKHDPAPEHWSCNDCKAVNDLTIEDCPNCSDGVRPST